MDEQREDDFQPPAATEKERLIRRRFEAHFAFTLNGPTFKRENTTCPFCNAPTN